MVPPDSLPTAKELGIAKKRLQRAEGGPVLALPAQCTQLGIHVFAT
jgi:hypothetical protein